MLKIGQKVKVRSDLEGGLTYGGVYFATSMCLYRNTTFTIEEIKSSSTGVECVRKNDWLFSKEMLVILEQPQPKNSIVSVTLDEFEVFFNDKKKTTVIKHFLGFFKKVTCSKEDTYSRRLGFLEAYFQYESGLTKNEAHEFLDNLEEL